MGYAERNKKAPEIIGRYQIVERKNVIKIGFVLDHYKRQILDKLWEDAEERAKKQLPKFDPTLRFHQEEKMSEDGKIIYSFRYYTPETNRILIDSPEVQ